MDLALDPNSQLPIAYAGIDDFYSPDPLTGADTTANTKGATWCGWWKHHGDFDNQTYFTMNFVLGSSELWLYDDGTGLYLWTYYDSVPVQLPSSDDWHFFLAEVDPTGTWRLQFDDTGTVYTVNDDIPSDPEFNFWPNKALFTTFMQSDDFPGSLLTVGLDELGVFPKTLTQAQKDYLYNSGDGRTFPLTLP
jgi:hypothetical protein